MNNNAYLPAFDSGPYSISEYQQFWRYCEQHELRFQQCRQCARIRHPPAPMCARCHCDQSEWILAPDDAFLFSFTIVHHATHLSLASQVPYNIAIVGFASLEPTRIVSNVIDCAPGQLQIGMRLELVWRESAEPAAYDPAVSSRSTASIVRRRQLPLFRVRPDVVTGKA